MDLQNERGMPIPISVKTLTILPDNGTNNFRR
jgi:hypothetical protein